MKWVVAAGFDFDNMAPAEMVLSRHVEYLRADTKLKAAFGGSGADPLKIRCCPFGVNLESGNPPMLFATIPGFDRQPGPGFFSETVTIRDVVRFHSVTPTSDEVLWEPGLLTIAHHISSVVTGSGARQLNYTTGGGSPVQLCSRVDLTNISVEQLKSPQTGEGINLYDLQIEFLYRLAVRTNSPRIWPLAVAEAAE